MLVIGAPVDNLDTLTTNLLQNLMKSLSSVGKHLPISQRQTQVEWHPKREVRGNSMTISFMIVRQLAHWNIV